MPSPVAVVSPLNLSGAPPRSARGDYEGASTLTARGSGASTAGRTGSITGRSRFARDSKESAGTTTSKGAKLTPRGAPSRRAAVPGTPPHVMVPEDIQSPLSSSTRSKGSSPSAQTVSLDAGASLSCPERMPIGSARNSARNSARGTAKSTSIAAVCDGLSAHGAMSAASSLAAAPTPAVAILKQPRLPAGEGSPLDAFIAAIPIADLLRPALKGLCGPNPATQPGHLRRIEMVHEALLAHNVLGALAGSIAHAASIEAAKISADAPFSTEPIESDEVRGLVEEAISKQEKATGPPKPPAPGLPPPPPPSGAEAFTGAQHLYGLTHASQGKGLPPRLWGVSKAQFVLFLDQARRHRLPT